MVELLPRQWDSGSATARFNGGMASSKGMSLADRHYRDIADETLPAAFQEPVDEVVATLDGTGNGDERIAAAVEQVLEESFRRTADRLYFELDVVHEQFRDRAELYDAMMQELDREIRRVEQEAGATTYDGAAEEAKERLHELRRERRQVQRTFLAETHDLQDRAVNLVQELDRINEDETVTGVLDGLLEQ